MLPLSQKGNRDAPETSSSLLFLPFTEKQQAVPPTHGFHLYREKKSAISQGITIPERAAKETQVSKQICTTIWNTAREAEEHTHTCPAQLPRRTEELQPKSTLQHSARRQCTQVTYSILHCFNTLFHFQMAGAEGCTRYHVERKSRAPLSFVTPRSI